MIAYFPLLGYEKLTLLLLRQNSLEEVVLLGSVDVENNMNDHIWEMAPLLELLS
jgi:hypothetical protein